MSSEGVGVMAGLEVEGPAEWDTTMSVREEQGPNDAELVLLGSCDGTATIRWEHPGVIRCGTAGLRQLADGIRELADLLDVEDGSR